MNCICCGKVLPDDSEFCAYCGKAVEKDLTPKCPKCGKTVTDDSLFCPYCGSAIGAPAKTAAAQNAFSTAEKAERREVVNDRVIPAPKHIPQEQIAAAGNPAPSKNIPTSQEGEKKTSKKPIIFIVVAIIAIALAAVLFSQPIDAPKTSTPISNTTQTSNLKPAVEPSSGVLLESSVADCPSSLTISASSGSSCVVKVKYPSGSTALSFYVRAGETVTVSVPASNLQVYFASGETWYGIKNLFGPNTYYSMDDDILDFANYTYEYTLYPVTNGNFSQTPIDASDF